ncbi:nitroreductase family protein [Zalerion maritima]|uniref:Nitroreductase family protein n=1 Tax=Zalerion maritima TaxID=339359 RepID=A0AAD5RTX6_9PEZI|nr:nitroreductase family protein [Zalerion maritima]
MPRLLTPLSFVLIGFLSAIYLPALLPSFIVNVRLTPPPNTNITLSATDNMADALFKLIRNRRSYYPLGKEIAVPKGRIEEIVKEAVLHTPSSFNSQSNRAVVLFGGEHDKFWDITTSVLKPLVPEEQWGQSSGKMSMFKGAAGTVLFFEDQAVVEGCQSSVPAYADKFPIWATQSDAMVQFVVWTALEAEGLGANLQHYNPLVDEKVAAEWKTPANWKLNAQLVFGAKTSKAAEKVFKDVNENVKVYAS